jgi:hypothetical protein
MNKNLYNVIAEALDIHCYFDGLRAKYSSNTRHTLRYITDMEKLHCQSLPTYRDWRMLLENLEEKANVILYEAECDIITAILSDAKKECEAELSKEKNRKRKTY